MRPLITWHHILTFWAHGQPIDSDFHPVPLFLKASALHGTGDSLPTLVLTVGQVMERRKDKTSTSSLEPTEYVLVIDAVAPGHPVWLIYNRNSIDDIGEPITADPADPDTPLAFKCIGHNFDAAQIFPLSTTGSSLMGMSTALNLRSLSRRLISPGLWRLRNFP